jgi:hypothetical protein
VSTDSSPGSVSALTSWPSARNVAATSSQAHAPSQNPGTRMIGALFMPVCSSLPEILWREGEQREALVGDVRGRERGQLGVVIRWRDLNHVGPDQG